MLLATEQTELLRNIYRALKLEDYFVFDVFTPQKYTDFLPTKDWQVEEDNFWTEDCCLHLQKNSHYLKTATYLEQHLLLYANDYKEFYIWETVFTLNELSKELEKNMFSSV